MTASGGAAEPPPPPPPQVAPATGGVEKWKKICARQEILIAGMDPAARDAYGAQWAWRQAEREIEEAYKPRVIAPSTMAPATFSSTAQPFSVADWSRHLSAQTAAKLRELCPPYTKVGDALPEQRDNDDFWHQAEVAVKAIGRDVDLQNFPSSAVDLVGPIICGPVAWAQLTRPSGGWNADENGVPYPSMVHSVAWQRFRAEFERVFGLTIQQKIERFYAAELKAGEAVADFVLRVYAQMNKLNRQLGANERLTPTSVLHIFKNKLPVEFRARVEAHRQAKAARGEPALTWVDLVRIVRDDRTGSSMLSEAERKGQGWQVGKHHFCRHEHGSEAGGMHHVCGDQAGHHVGTGMQSELHHSTYGQQYHAVATANQQTAPGVRQRRHCDICSRLKAPFVNHDTKDCFCNPLSAEYRPEVRYRRLMSAERQGVPIPADILAMAPHTPGKPPAPIAKLNSVMTTQQEADMRVSLQCGGYSDPHVVDEVVDATLAQFLSVARPAQFYGSVQHCSDGAYSSQVLSVAAGSGVVEQVQGQSGVDLGVHGASGAGSAAAVGNAVVGGAVGQVGQIPAATAHIPVSIAGESGGTVVGNGGNAALQVAAGIGDVAAPARSNGDICNLSQAIAAAQAALSAVQRGTVGGTNVQEVSSGGVVGGIGAGGALAGLQGGQAGGNQVAALSSSAAADLGQILAAALGVPAPAPRASGNSDLMSHLVKQLLPQIPGGQEVYCQQTAARTVGGVEQSLYGATGRRPPLDLNTIVSRMRAALPLLARTSLDRGLRIMVLVRLVRQCVEDGTPVPILQGQLVQYMQRPTFDELERSLSGLTEHNVVEVEGRLRQLGIGLNLPRVEYGTEPPPPPPQPQPPAPQPQPVPAAPPPVHTPAAGQLPHGVVGPDTAMGGQAAAVLNQLAQQLAQVTAAVIQQQPQNRFSMVSAPGYQPHVMQAQWAQSGLVGDVTVQPRGAKRTIVSGHPPSGYAVPRMPARPLPQWYDGKLDRRDILPWDSEQVIQELQVNDTLVHGCVDTGACRSLMSVSFAEACGLPITWATAQNCGTYSVPGAQQLQAYAGVVERCTFTFAREVKFEVFGLRVIHHPQPLLLIGSDVLRGGRGPGELNFTGLQQITDGLGKVRGYLGFRRDTVDFQCACVNVPADGVAPFAYNPQAAPQPVKAPVACAGGAPVIAGTASGVPAVPGPPGQDTPLEYCNPYDWETRPVQQVVAGRAGGVGVAQVSAPAGVTRVPTFNMCAGAHVPPTRVFRFFE